MYSQIEIKSQIERNAPTIRGKVYRYIEATDHRGTTCAELEEVLDLKHQTASARINELEHAGLVVRTMTKGPNGGHVFVTWNFADPYTRERRKADLAARRKARQAKPRDVTQLELYRLALAALVLRLGVPQVKITAEDLNAVGSVVYRVTSDGYEFSAFARKNDDGP